MGDDEEGRCALGEQETARYQCAAVVAAGWWAARLAPAWDERRMVFAQWLAGAIDAVFQAGERRVVLACDYDPDGVLLEAVQAVVDPACRGFGFSAKGILPMKHVLVVERQRLEAQAGRGAPWDTWTMADERIAWPETWDALAQLVRQSLPLEPAQREDNG